MEDPAEPALYDQEWTIVLDDWIDGTGYTPDQILAGLRQGMTGMNMPSASPSPSMSGMGGMSGMTVASPSPSMAEMSGMNMSSPSPSMSGMAGMGSTGSSGSSPQMCAVRPGTSSRRWCLAAGRPASQYGLDGRVSGEASSG